MHYFCIHRSPYNAISQSLIAHIPLSLCLFPYIFQILPIFTRRFPGRFSNAAFSTFEIKTNFWAGFISVGQVPITWLRVYFMETVCLWPNYLHFYFHGSPEQLKLETYVRSVSQRWLHCSLSCFCFVERTKKICHPQVTEPRENSYSIATCLLLLLLLLFRCFLEICVYVKCYNRQCSNCTAQFSKQTSGMK